MKRKSFLDNALMIIAAAAIIFSLVMTAQTFDNGPQFDYSSKHIDRTNPSPNNEYVRIRDSLRTVVECEDMQLSDLGVSHFIATIGLSKLPTPVNCGAPVRRGNAENKECYYLAVAGYKISKESSFYLEGNKYMITSGQQGGNKSGDSYGGNMTKEIPVRYVKPAPGFRNQQSGYILVPIPERVYHTLYIVMLVIYGLVCVLVLQYAIIRTLRIILGISKGRMFSHQSTRDLLVAGRVFMALAITPLFLQLVFYYVFNKEIPAQIRPAFGQVVWENKIYFIVGFTMVLIAKAFEKGYKLQKENSSII